jgi:NAD(P)-dependent dehydrogenase (short-subunit alcohol dehydrogenase family)
VFESVVVMSGPRVVLVTGGSSGIGLATAGLFAERGDSVVLVGRDHARLELARQDVVTRAAPGVTVDVFAADTSTLPGIDALVEHVRDHFGHVDVVFANAGRADAPELLEADEAAFDATFDANVKSVFFLAARTLPLFTDGGAFIATSSVAQDKGRPGGPLYSASKAAVRSLVRTLALDEAVLDRHVRVNAVVPGSIATPLTTIADPTVQAMLDDFVVSTTPMARYGTADEVARAVHFLADEASYTTGAELLVDGGLAQT